MRPRLPPLNALKAFEAAARHESFTRAAEELCVTQGAVSHQVKALEAELAIKLFNRERQRLIITEAGKDYLTVCPKETAALPKIVTFRDCVERSTPAEEALPVAAALKRRATNWNVQRANGRLLVADDDDEDQKTSLPNAPSHLRRSTTNEVCRALRNAASLSENRDPGTVLVRIDVRSFR
jgi:hypothetical protein